MRFGVFPCFWRYHLKGVDQEGFMVDWFAKALYIHVYLWISVRGWLHKPIRMSRHAMIQADERGIGFPEQVCAVLQSGKIERFGKRGVRFVSDSIICIGEDKGHEVVIKTVEWRNK